MNLQNLIIGGGLAGITIALHLLEQKKDFLLIESSNRLGGKIETKITNEACYEFGPNSFTNQTEDIFQLLDMLDMGSEVLEANAAAQNRYILKRGKITPLPSKPQEILTTKALSFWGRLRFLREFFYVPKQKKNEESVWDFFARHFGREVANYFADPFVSGVFAGDASQLSLKESFPTMDSAEAQSSSLIRYLMAQRKTAKATPKIFQLKHGLESIFHNALEKIGEEKFHLETTVQDIIPSGKTLRVVTDKDEYETETLYLTTPAYVSAQILKKRFPNSSQLLDKIDYTPVVTAHLRVSRKENYPFNGFGILIPSVEKRGILGALWNSSSFPSLFSDKDNHYLTVYVGGTRQKSLALADDTTIHEVIDSEILNLFSLRHKPSFIHMRRHPKAIPQYTLGYGKILEALRNSLSAYPSLKLAGNYLGGISMPKTVAYATEVVVGKKKS